MKNKIPQSFKKGLRLIMLIQRGKEGGKSNKPDRVSIRKLSSNEIEFNEIVEEFEKIKENTNKELRIYSCMNKRDINKAIHEFKKLQLDAEYWDSESRNRFYLDIKNRWISCMMKPNSRAESFFLIDIDEKNEEIISQIKDKLTRLPTSPQTTIIFEYQTKNGYHLITTSFNPSLFKFDNVEIKKDGMLLLEY